MKKINRLTIGILILASAGILSGCIDHKESKGVRIIKECDIEGQHCIFTLDGVTVDVQTNLLGQTKERIYDKKPLLQDTTQATKNNITWEVENASLASNADIEIEFGKGCENNVCTDSSNPTAYTFEKLGAHEVSVKGEVTVDGKKVNLSKVPPVYVDTEKVSDSHTFLSGTDPDIPEADMQKIVDALNTKSKGEQSANGTFTRSGDTWKITCAPHYVWLDDQNPAWGGQSDGPGRWVADVRWDRFDHKLLNATASPNKTITFNAFDGNSPQQASIAFRAGCWPEVPES